MQVVEYPGYKSSAMASMNSVEGQGLTIKLSAGREGNIIAEKGTGKGHNISYKLFLQAPST